MFGYHPRPVTSTDDILTIARLHLDEEDTERLVGWIAWRLGRNQALAGAGSAGARLEHVVTHWLDEGRRQRLARWLAHRVATGRPPVPR